MSVRKIERKGVQSVPDTEKGLIPEDIMVVGGGIAGLISAIRLKQAGYRKVEVIETGEDVFSGTSAVINEAHSGAEYPFDEQSGRDCMRSLVGMVRLLPREVFINKGVTMFFVSEKNKEMLPIMRNHVFNTLKDEYLRLIKEDPKNEVLGDPEKVFRELDPSEYTNVSGVVAGFITPQRGIGAAHMAAILKQAAIEHGVDFHFNTEVKKITDISEVGGAHGGSYSVEVTKPQVPGGSEACYTTDQVVLAANYRGFKLAHDLNPEYSRGDIYAGLRQIVKVRISPESIPFLPQSQVPGERDGVKSVASCFTLEGKNGGMLGPYSPGYALVYFPPESQIERILLDGDIPERWKEILSERNSDMARAQRILDGVRDLYPVLDGATIETTYVKVAISPSENSRSRPNPEIGRVNDGVHDINFITKATNASQNANRLAMNALRTSLERGVINSLEFEEALARLQGQTIELPAKFHDKAGLDRALRAMAASMDLPLDAVRGFTIPSHRSRSSEAGGPGF